ncbi:MAG TPA: ATP-binding protein, partial [Myxococcota bacterium]|nr:ATP-binding protein [Myxococcota bacterium]
MAAAIAPRERAHLLKHNPGFLTDDELISAFVARTAELRLLLDHLDANSDARVNQHMLLVGARGLGKSTLVRRFAAEIRRRPELRARWMPLVFGEESYAVTSLGELWLEALLHLADATGEARWREAHAALRAEQDDHRLAGLALARLLDFCDASGRRIVLVIENLGMLIDEQLDEGSAWQLRKVLQSEPRVALVATAVARFDGIERSDEPLFDLFAVHDLGPLDLDEIAALWRTVTDRELRGQQARPLQILTGGNPRLLAMLGGFAKGRSLRRLMDDLTSLIDEHTSYFKANIEVLPAQERKVFSALADLWRPSTAAEVAEHARLTSTKASAWLVRLTQRGVVTALGEGKRDRRYQITERLYNIYHLMRRRSGPEARVTAVVDFLVHLYEPPELMERMWRIADEAEEQLDPDHLAVLDRVTGRVDAECAAMIALSVPATLVARLPEVARIRQLARDELQDQGDDPEVMVARLGLAILDGEIGALEALVPRAEAILERASPSAAPTPTLELLHMAVAMVSLLPPPVIVQLTADALALTRRFGWSFWGRLAEMLRALNDAMDRSLRAGRRPPDPALERHARELRQMADDGPDNGLLQLLAASVDLWVDG